MEVVAIVFELAAPFVAGAGAAVAAPLPNRANGFMGIAAVFIWVPIMELFNAAPRPPNVRGFDGADVVADAALLSVSCVALNMLPNAFTVGSFTVGAASAAGFGFGLLVSPSSPNSTDSISRERSDSVFANPVRDRKVLRKALAPGMPLLFFSSDEAASCGTTTVVAGVSLPLFLSSSFSFVSLLLASPDCRKNVDTIDFCAAGRLSVRSAVSGARLSNRFVPFVIATMLESNRF
mmetsp:Transcript_20402/g.58018  ORF Transcript_20402/g.58018 Transcript_20402/m.58018 type:complete len:235 (-) Transcript_20402:1245-1949(-)